MQASQRNLVGRYRDVGLDRPCGLIQDGLSYVNSLLRVSNSDKTRTLTRKWYSEA